ncbi:MAG: EamA family transporter [Nitrospirota bacterium]|nr:EamA family transporter [Nitrospirota bacterium]MDH5585496.1 EamA family transporter [Nitrospirota bacterium]MDH5773441.1 EamA family transporter [Nitrospirota bacterium]
MSPKHSLGPLCGLGAALLFGLTTPLIKLILPVYDLLPIAGLLYVGAGLGLGLCEIFLTSTKQPVFSQPETPIQRADISPLLGIILTGGILGPILMLYGLQRISGVVGSLLLNLEAPLTILLAVTFFHEHLGKREVSAAMFIFAGAGILSYSPGTLAGDWLGIISISGACVCWAVDNNLTQGLSLRNPLAVARIKGLSAGGFSLGLAWMLGYDIPDITAVIMVLFLGFVGYGISVVLDIYALRILGAAREAAFFATAPFIGALAAVPILGEHWGFGEYLAGATMAIGLGVLLREHHSHIHTHPAMEHDHVHTHTDPHHQHDHQEETVGSHAHRHSHLPLQHDHGHVSDLHHRHKH